LVLVVPEPGVAHAVPAIARTARAARTAKTAVLPMSCFMLDLLALLTERLAVSERRRKLETSAL